MAGRPILPTNLKVIRGTAKPCRMNENEPRPEKVVNVKCPANLSTKEKQCWNHLAEQLQKAGILTTIDLNALMTYCKLWVIWQEKTSQADVEITPTVDRIFKQLLALWREFGMTPSSRTRIRSENQAPEDDFDAWQKKRRMAREGV